MDNLFSKLIDNASVLVLYTDANGNVSICNKEITAITGKSKDDIIGKNWLSVLYGHDNSNIKQQMFKAIMDDSVMYKRSNNFEDVFIDIHNNEKLVFWNITPMLTEEKNLEGILLIGNDITALKEREASAKKIDETLHNIFSSIKEYALYVTNLDGNITYYGMGSEVMFGWQKNEIVFKHVSILHKDEDRKFKLPFILEQLRRKGLYELDIDLVKKDGQSFPVTLTVSRFLDTEEKLTGYIFMAKDITERKKLEYQIFQAEKLAALGQLVAGMAHEISNPLFVISGRLEIILAQKRLAKKLKEGLNIINAQAERIRNLVDRLLKFSRKVPPRLETVDINAVIETVLPLLAYHRLPAAKIEIEKQLAQDLLPVKADLNQLQEVFVNLLINAYQAMPEGGKITIRTANLENKFAEIRISDTGHGIAAENLKDIFMPFFSTKKEGTGLGLSICYNIIKSHSGFIDIETQVNKGTTFIIKLPFT